ncbi:phasin family protein [Paraburkholderia panacisoli]|uniref:Phasin family protein n=1 Tax=Paraburkholderia panacisoli TaxID=2603818 RepID=A0A5B0H8D0_9BURK|nr:TIGR01841 family phasin [Paraburkholderia panacisoli]KAA1011449.1 phasin family protein [Paraburkholderia panacisoli]
MNSFIPEQTITAAKASLDTTFGLANKAFQGFEKLVELNAQTVKTTLAEAQELVAKSLISNAPQAAFAVQENQLRAGVQKTQAYWTHVKEIVSSSQAEFEAAAKAVFKQPSFDAKAWFDNMAKHTLPGGDAILAIWKSSLGAAGQSASAAYETATKATKKTVETAVIEA